MESYAEREFFYSVMKKTCKHVASLKSGFVIYYSQGCGEYLMFQIQVGSETMLGARTDTLHGALALLAIDGY